MNLKIVSQVPTRDNRSKYARELDLVLDGTGPASDPRLPRSGQSSRGMVSAAITPAARQDPTPNGFAGPGRYERGEAGTALSLIQPTQQNGHARAYLEEATDSNQVPICNVRMLDSPVTKR
jgi:hypothetical protein